MRKSIKRYIIFSSIIWLIIMFMIAIAEITMHSASKILYIIASIGGVVMFSWSFSLSLNLTSKGFDKDWFKTQEELQQERIKLKEDWDKVYEMRTILGNHEAIKLWEEAKQKEGGNDEKD